MLLYDYMRKILKIILPLFLLYVFANAALAQDRDGVNVYFFYGDGCPHCADEEIFLNQLEKENESINIQRYEMWRNEKNAELLNDLAERFNWSVRGVPVTVVGEEEFIGFYNGETTGAQIKRAVENCLVKGEWCRDAVAEIISGAGDKEKKELNKQEKINLPFFGEMDKKNLSLPLLTVVIAVLDGFNPCAMWILLFLISILLATGERKKMWAVGLTFIFVSAIFYFGVLASWLNILLVIGFLPWIRVGIALAAFIAGGYSLKKYWLDRKGVCEVIDEEKRKNLFNRLRNAVGKSLGLAILGTVVLAVSVNFIELVCSAGLPAVYTQVLAMSKLLNWQYYAYLALYSFVFIAGQLIVFLAAMFTLKLKAIGAKYMSWTRLIGGIIMVVIGLLLLFKPAWLMFG